MTYLRSLFYKACKLVYIIVKVGKKTQISKPQIIYIKKKKTVTHYN